MNKLKLWNRHSNWEAAEAEWDEGKERAQKENPLKVLKNIPDMPGIAEETAKNLKWKSLWWMVSRDNGEIRRHFLKHPFRYGLAFLKSVFKGKSYQREGDFFYYGVDSLQSFQSLLQSENTLLVVGFSYCEKPFECPSKRFTPDCIHDPENLVCRQCFIGKAINAMPEKKSEHVIIPTVHHIGEAIFKAVHANPNKQVLFLITACEMTLEMFGDYGNMAQVKGIGVRLAGRICNTFKAFELSERGIKPGLTLLLEATEQKVLELLKQRRNLELQE